MALALEAVHPEGCKDKGKASVTLSRLWPRLPTNWPRLTVDRSSGQVGSARPRI